MKLFILSSDSEDQEGQSTHTLHGIFSSHSLAQEAISESINNLRDSTTDRDKTKMVITKPTDNAVSVEGGLFDSVYYLIEPFELDEHCDMKI